MRRILALVFSLLLPLLSIQPAAAQTDPVKAQEFVRTLGDMAVNTLARADLTPEQEEKRFRELLNQNFDVPTIARFVLGQYWNQATADEQKEYMTLFEDLIVSVYADRFSSYSGEKFDVQNARAEGPRDAIVNTQIISPKMEPVTVGWRVRDRDGSLKIVDVLVGGVSMGTSQRSEFASVIQRSGGKVAGLLESLRERAKKN